MNILIVIGFVVLCYFVIYGIFKFLSIILVALKVPWAAVLAGCAAVIAYLRQYSFLNYVVVAITLLLLGKLLITQVTATAGKKANDKKEYRQAQGVAYACLLSFLALGALYANLNYILAVQIGGLTMEEYREMGFLTGKVLDLIGFKPVRWFILAITGIALARSYFRIFIFDINCCTFSSAPAPEEKSSGTVDLSKKE